MHIVDLVLDGRGHECGKPPGGHLGPKGRVNDVKGLESLLVPVGQRVVNLLNPPVAGDVVSGRSGVEVDDHVVALGCGGQHSE